MTLKTLVYVITLILPLASVTAQSDTRLIGPLLAFTPAAQDRILLLDVSTGSQRELTFGSGWHHVWGFSPEGCRILFTRSEDTNLARMYSARIDGSDVKALVDYPELPAEQWGVWEPQWSPDGERIAFTMQRDGFEGEVERQYHIAWIPAAGGEPRFYSVTGREHSPKWSPDGQWLAYISYDERVAGTDVFSTAEPTQEPLPGRDNPPPALLKEADMWIVSADAATKYRLTNFSTGSVTKPRWSPDGELVSFVYSPSPSNDMFWMIANQQGAIPTQLSNQWSLVLDTTWMPDSSAIIAAVRDFREVNENLLWRIPLLGNADSEATLFIDNAVSSHADYPRFSADGSLLAYRSAYGLVIADSRTQEIIYQDNNLPGNTPAVWSPTGFNGESACRNN